MPDLPFQLRFRELAQAKEEIPLPAFPELKVTAYRVKHRVTCYCYRFSLERKGRFDAEAAKRLQIPLPFWNRLQRGETIPDGDKVYTPEMVLGPDRKGLVVAYCTDSRPCDSIAEAAEGADLFICEGMYGEDSMLPKVREKTHMLFSEAAGLAKKAGARELWLTHYSPAENHPENFAENATKIFENAWVCRDGKSASLRFEDENDAAGE